LTTRAVARAAARAEVFLSGHMPWHTLVGRGRGGVEGSQNIIIAYFA